MAATSFIASLASVMPSWRLGCVSSSVASPSVKDSEDLGIIKKLSNKLSELQSRIEELEQRANSCFGPRSSHDLCTENIKNTDLEKFFKANIEQLESTEKAIKWIEAGARQAEASTQLKENSQYHELLQKSSHTKAQIFNVRFNNIQSLKKATEKLLTNETVHHSDYDLLPSLIEKVECGIKSFYYNNDDYIVFLGIAAVVGGIGLFFLTLSDAVLVMFGCGYIGLSLIVFLGSIIRALSSQKTLNSELFECEQSVLTLAKDTQAIWSSNFEDSVAHSYIRAKKDPDLYTAAFPMSKSIKILVAQRL